MFFELVSFDESLDFLFLQNDLRQDGHFNFFIFDSGCISLHSGQLINLRLLNVLRGGLFF